MFLDGPAYLDRDGRQRCGLPAEVRCQFIIESTDGPPGRALIRCPAGHWFTAPIESLTLKNGPGPRGRPAVPGRPGQRAGGAAAMMTPPGTDRDSPGRGTADRPLPGHRSLRQAEHVPLSLGRSMACTLETERRHPR